MEVIVEGEGKEGVGGPGEDIATVIHIVSPKPEHVPGK